MCHFPIRIADVFEPAALDDVRTEADLLEELLEVGEIADDPYTSRDRARVCHNAIGGRGNVISPGSCDPAQGSHHRLYFDSPLDFPIELLRSADASAWRLNSKQNALDIRVLAKLSERFQWILNAVNQTAELNHTDLIRAGEPL